MTEPGIPLPSTTAPQPATTAVRRGRLLACAFAVIVVAAGIATLPHYGVTCDEAYGNMFFGERYLHYWLTLDRAYLDFRYHNLPIHRRTPDLFAATWRFLPYVFPPLADTLSAGTMELFGHRLHWMDPFDAFHLATVLLVGVLLVRLYSFAAPRAGPLPALAGVLLLGSYPRFWGDMHNNVKDIPEAVFFSLTVMALAEWSEHPSLKRALVAGLLGGAALAVKVNAVFVPVIAIAGLLPWARSSRPWVPVVRQLVRSGWHYLVMLGSALALWIAVWPWLHRNTFARLVKHLRAFASQGGRQGQAGWNPDPLVQTLATMPEVFLLLLFAGLVVLALRVGRGGEGSGYARLLLAWLAVPILRNSIPGAVNFDGIRHFVEFVPAAALIAGVGAVSLVRAVVPRWQPLAATAVTVLVAANVGEAVARYHPYESIYFNELVGGLRGAAEAHRFPQATDYWGSSYRHGLAWLKGHAERDATLYVSVQPHIVALTEASWSRPDLRYVDSEGYGAALAARRTVYVMFVTREEHYEEIARSCVRDQVPVYHIDVAGRTILLIYRVLGPLGCGDA